MTEEQEKLITNVFFKIQENKWYKTNGETELIENLKLCHDIHDNILFSDDYMHFKKIQPWKIFIESLDNPNGINIKFEFKNMEDVSFDYSHLNGNEPPKIGQKEWSKKAGRGN